jgi:predicted SAM-dependent methyltransferase
MNSDTSWTKYLPESFRNRYGTPWYEFKLEVQITLGKLKRLFNRPSFSTLKGEKQYLHLGCGPVNHPKFINIDGVPSPHIHYVRAIDNLALFKNNSVDLIYACHCLEHFSPQRVPLILNEWFRVLKEGGILRLSVPDFDLLLNIYKENRNNIKIILPYLLGGQNDKFNSHKILFTASSLEDYLKSAGFKSIQKWQPGSSELTTFNDWSGRPIYTNGKPYPVSLNLEAIK